MSLPLAHLGHWWSYILYAVPLAIVIATIVVTSRQERRERLASQRTEGSGEEEGEGKGER